MIKKGTLAIGVVLLIALAWFSFLKPDPATINEQVKKVETATKALLPPPKTEKSNKDSESNTVANNQPPEVSEVRLFKLRDCLNENELPESLKLKKFVEQKLWNRGPITRSNLIFKKGSVEKRISLVPTPETRMWQVKIFDVDEEQLPILLEENKLKTYEEARSYFTSLIKDFKLVSEQNHIEVNTDTARGSILFVNGEPEDISLFNPKSRKMFECVGSACGCNDLSNQ